MRMLKSIIPVKHNRVTAAIIAQRLMQLVRLRLQDLSLAIITIQLSAILQGKEVNTFTVKIYFWITKI